jgi:hypothetical protein
MCILCDGTPLEKESERNRILNHANDLQFLASYLRSLAHGTIKPHDASARSNYGPDTAREYATRCVRFLAGELL